MTHEAIATGTTIDDARSAAITKLNAPEDVDVQVEVLEMPVKKTLGIFGGAPAKVRAYYEESPSMIAVIYLKSVLQMMNVTGLSIDTKETSEGLEITVECDDYGLIIGHRGDTLDALQYLTGLVANRIGDEYYRVTINTLSNYREKREGTLASLARKTAIQVSKTGRSVTLEPMNPYERRIVHTAVQSIRGAKSHSVGEDSSRCVVISPDENYKPYRKPYKDNSKGYGSKNKGGYQKRGDHRPRNNNRPNSGSGFSKPSSDRQPHKEYSNVQLYGQVDKKKND